MSARWKENREIAKRVVIEGTLTLLTPARFGGGGDEHLTDMPLLRDQASGDPLLPGASIAGAMRSYLREWEMGYEKKTPARVEETFQELFGHVVEGEGVSAQEQQSLESFLIIEDAIAEKSGVAFRPGVKIDPKTRTVAYEEGKGGQLYDMELLQAGTQFPLRFELALPDDEAQQQELLAGLAVPLAGFEGAEIGLGARKRRGFGECEVTNWQVQHYNLKDPKDLVDWIEGKGDNSKSGKPILELLDVELPEDKRKRFTLEAHFQLKTSLLIGSGSGAEDDPETVHLQSQRLDADEPTPILSGTSLAGAMRARATRIANTLYADKSNARELVNQVFGPDEVKEISEREPGEEPFASRVVIHEREVQGNFDLVQTRIRIDRFTGGTYPGALFEQQPVFGGENSDVCVSVELRHPEDEHIGLLLQVLKDLWTGDLPLGGEASVGRGRLQGIKAEMSLQVPNKEKETWTISAAEGGSLNIEGNRERLEDFAKALAGGA